MEERNDMDKIEEEMMPGFRFHPTDEEIVDFYLKRKIQQKSLPIELIKQVDIYKYEPWDLPKLASTGEKEWYFYCPRDRKYRNSARPNRVTRAGFWKATGTDRPIYSSEGRCIGLKKSLVFYRGRAAKGMKTDWMMHEFRLPCLSDSAGPPKKVSDKSLPASDSWAICRVFQKPNSVSMAQKAFSHPWISQLPGSMVSDIMITHCNHFSSSENNMSCTTETASPPPIQFSNANNTNFSPRSDHIPSYKPISSGTVSKPSAILNNPVSDGDFSDNFIFYTLEATTGPTNSNPDCIGFHDEEPNQHQHDSGFSISVPHQDLQANMGPTNTVLVDEEEEEEEQRWRKSLCNPVQVNNLETTRTIGFPFSLPPNVDAWNNKAATVAWDSPPPCPSELSTSYSTNNKCYT